MPSTIKVFAHNSSTAVSGTTVIYTCPASTVAKVLLSQLFLSTQFGNSTDRVEFHIGTVGFQTGAIGTPVIYNLQLSAAGASPSTIPPVVELYLAAGETVRVFRASNDMMKQALAKFVVIEEVAS